MKKNVFILGADDFNLAQLHRSRQAEQCAFHPLYSYLEIKQCHEPPIALILERSRHILHTFPGRVDAIVGWWDFPVSTLLPILRREFHLPTPSLESVLKCEHKYWSRLEQARSVPEHIPNFCVFNPFSDNVSSQIDLAFPFWVKPIKSSSSILGFKIRNSRDLKVALAKIRKNIHQYAEPLNHILSYADLPSNIAPITGDFCIAEELISSGRQVTLEGYVFNGDMDVYGIVDSIRDSRHRSCFTRYQYPSALPSSVHQRMIEVTRRFLKHIEFDQSPFNAEFYWERSSDRIWLLEVNARISKSHCPLFQLVDGASHQEIMVDVALGNRPAFPHRQGPFLLAAKCMVRQFQNAIVQRVPSRADIQAVKERFPGTEIEVHVQPGMKLSDLPHQDSYSYEVAVIFMGAASERSLLTRYHQCLDMLGFDFLPLAA